MSKRSASEYITKDGIGSMQGQDDAPVQRATAAQLANRKIAQARGRSGARHRTAQSSGFSTPSTFGSSTSQSFPPVNGPSAVGNGTASVSFGGFGSGGIGSSSTFNFSAGGIGTINNPFAQQSQQPSTNGAGSGSIFNFGGGQSQTSSPFQFGSTQPQQPASNIFGASQTQSTPTFGGFGASQSTGTTSLFSTSTSQPASISGFGGFGSSSSATTTNSSNLFSGTFGQSAAPSTSTPAPSFGGFGQAAPSFGQTNGDSMMSITPESSPQKRLGWNKDVTNGMADAQNDGAESPDRPPHVEQESGTRPNPFQNIQRANPPAPTPKPAEPKPASAPLFSFSQPAAVEKSTELGKSQEQEKENQKPSLFASAKQTSTEAPTNPFATIQRMSQSTQSPLSQTPSQPEQPKSLFASTPITAQSSSSPAKPSLFNPSTTLSSFSKPAENVPLSQPAPQSEPEPTRIQWGKVDTSSKPAETIFSKPTAVSLAPEPSPAPQSPEKAATLPTPSTAKSAFFQQLLPIVLREDNLQAPNQSLNSEEKTSWYQVLKLKRLNQIFSQMWSKAPDHADLSSYCRDYILLAAEIKKPTENGRLGGIATVPKEGTNKRKASPSEEQEPEKRPKTNGDAPASETGSKFQSIFESSGQKNNIFQGTSNIFAAASPTPAKTANIFAQSTASPAPAPSPAKSLFSSSTAAPASSGSSLFSSKSNATLANSTEANSTNVYSKESTASATSTTPASGGTSVFQFKPVGTSKASSAPPATTFVGFKPTNNSTASSSAGPPKLDANASASSFLSQFAKSAEETAKEAKRKAMLEDYDSDEETKEEWSARYDREQEEKKKKLAASATSSFKFTPTSSVAGSNAGSGDEAESKAKPSFLAPPTTNSLFSGLSRTPSPVSAASPSGSVFDMPRSNTPGQLSKDNPFANLSRQASEKGDADDEDEDSSADGDVQSLDETNEEGQNTNGEATPKVNGVQKRVGPFEEDESEESRPTTPKPAEERKDGLFGRVSRDPPVSGDRTPLATTGANTSSVFSTSATTAGIWTPKDPIKFANKDTSSEGEKETAKKPLFNFAPVGSSSQAPQSVFSGLFAGTQNSSATPSGPATPSLFANLNASASKPSGGNSLLAPPSGATSVFSTPGWNSRASSVAPSDVSGAESTAGEGEEPKPDVQIDISDMAKDKEGHEVIFESSKVKATRFEKADEAAKRAEGWQVIGVGPIAILKNDDTGVVSILMRTTPSGKIIINTRMSSILKAEVMKKRARIIILSKSGPEPHLISFQTEDDCKAFVDACKANGAK
ncbi:uncharacterized protein PV09_00706 [Verruconis gallopava]|uniref:RanBD1 domain-containing protein n=1 Tax=Verruconis gallopava TaxID=253628 RepID=A0A0D2APZ3_9PEZI|nr:uncharacterized protein PV09_00706 [Verruconis gallopava]KIW08768.1 hypothetical protein PV09_00706 [Verruconis gallopava]